MEIIEWYGNVNDQLTFSLIEEIKNNASDIDEIKTKDAIAICKTKLFGDYNALLVRNMEEYLSDAEVYVLTWDGEASDGGEMFKLNSINLEEIIYETIFGGND